MSGLSKAQGLDSNPIVLAMATLAIPPVYNDIANLGDFTGPMRAVATAKVTAHGDYAERIVATLLSEGSVSGSLYYIPAAGQVPSHTDPTNGIQAVFERKDLRSYAIFYRDSPGTAKFFNAFITKLSEKDPVSGVLTADVEFSIDNFVSTGLESEGPSTAVFRPAQ